MPNLNLVQLMGNLTRTPELAYTPNGTPIVKFGMAINRTYMVGDEKREEVTFLDIEFWGKQAEAISKYVEKGHALYVQGRLKLDTWEDKESGKKRSKIHVVGENFQFLHRKEGGVKTSSEEEADATGAKKPPAPPKTAAKPKEQEDVSFEEDDVPF